MITLICRVHRRTDDRVLSGFPETHVYRSVIAEPRDSGRRKRVAVDIHTFGFERAHRVLAELFKPIVAQRERGIGEVEVIPDSLESGFGAAVRAERALLIGHGLRGPEGDLGVPLMAGHVAFILDGHTRSGWINALDADATEAVAAHVAGVDQMFLVCVVHGLRMLRIETAGPIPVFPGCLLDPLAVAVITTVGSGHRWIALSGIGVAVVMYYNDTQLLYLFRARALSDCKNYRTVTRNGK